MNAAKKPAAGRRLTILVADDDADTTRTLSTLLELEGHVVDTVNRGDIAIEAIKRYKPDVCILDIEMPGLSGYGIATEILKAIPEPERPFLIAISGRWNKPADRLLAESLGFHKFIRKPADPDTLLGYLDELTTGGNSRA